MRVSRELVLPPPRRPRADTGVPAPPPGASKRRPRGCVRGERRGTMGPSVLPGPPRCALTVFRSPSAPWASPSPSLAAPSSRTWIAAGSPTTRRAAALARARAVAPRPAAAKGARSPPEGPTVRAAPPEKAAWAGPAGAEPRRAARQEAEPQAPHGARSAARARRNDALEVPHEARSAAEHDATTPSRRRTQRGATRATPTRHAARAHGGASGNRAAPQETARRLRKPCGAAPTNRAPAP